MSPQDQIRTTIGEDVEITGNIKCESSIEINGKLNGDLNCTGAAHIGKACSVKGNMSIETVTIMGQVNGNITAKDKIELKAAAKLHGDIRAKRLTVEDGVAFVGKVDVNPAGSGNAKQVPEPKQTLDQSPPVASDDEEDVSDKDMQDSQRKNIFRR